MQVKIHKTDSDPPDLVSAISTTPDDLDSVHTPASASSQDFPSADLPRAKRPRDVPHDEFSDISDPDSSDSSDELGEWDSDDEVLRSVSERLIKRDPKRTTRNAFNKRRIRPSYYYDWNAPGNTREDHIRTRVRDERSRRLRGSEKGIPVFEPTNDEFQNEGGFYGYVKRIEKYGLRHGIVKVVPPREWHQAMSRDALFSRLTNVQLRDAIQQNVFGAQGFFQVTNIAKSTAFNPYQWWSYATRNNSPPNADPDSRASHNAKATRKRAEMTPEELAELHASFDKLPVDPEKYTPEYCLNIEKSFWRSLSSANPPMYAADQRGSLFDPEETPHWNVAQLGDILPDLTASEPLVSGVTSPYLYFGSWRAMFPWHLEDKQLYSINYIHFGAPKFWYAVPQAHRQRFERAMETWFPIERRQCPEFLRHKSFLASPRALSSLNIPAHRVVQLPGEFIITYPHGYHAGFNMGYNCAESINFATPRWLAYGRDSNACQCIPDSVSFDVDHLLSLARNKKRKTSPHPPTSARKTHASRNIPEASAVEDVKPNPCCICPNHGLRLVPTDNPNMSIHDICFKCTPPLSQGSDGQGVTGIDHIAKGRYKLKCSICKSTEGAKIQCTRGKCILPFHPSCMVLNKDPSLLLATMPKNGGTWHFPLLTDAKDSSQDSILISRVNSLFHDGHYIDTGDHYCVAICAQHNPVYQEQKRLKEAEEHAQWLRHTLDHGGLVQVIHRGTKYKGHFSHIDSADERYAYIDMEGFPYRLKVDQIRPMKPFFLAG